MKIIINKQYNRINIQFDEKPAKEVLQELKNEGWRYSPQNNLWYPSAAAVENSASFASNLRRKLEPVQNERTWETPEEEIYDLIQHATDYELSKENTEMMINELKAKIVKNHESSLETKIFEMEKLLSDMKEELKNTREKLNKYENKKNEITFPVVVLPQSSDFVESWSANHNSVAKGLFIIKEDDKLVAIDNTEGECWVEDFDSLDKAVTYLTNSSFSPEEISELNDADAHAAALNKLTEADLVLINDNILNSNVFVTADIGNPVELALHNPKTGEYFLIQSIDDDDRWDYTLYDKDFKLIDGGQGVSGDITMPEDIRTAAQVILREFHPDDLSINDWVIRDYSDLSELINEIEAVNYERAVDSIQQRWEEHDNGLEQARDERDSREMNAELSRLDAEAEAMERANGLREMDASIDEYFSPIGGKTNLTNEDWKFINENPELFENWRYLAAFKFATEGKPITELTGNEFQKVQDESIVTRVLDYYTDLYNNEVKRNEIGIVILDKEGIKDSLAHGMSRLKASAYAAVPKVIESGIIYNYENNWKNRNYDTCVVIAPVNIDGKVFAEEVVLKKRPNKTGFYLHEVELKEKLLEMFKTPTERSKSKSYLIIARHFDKVKNCNVILNENYEPSKEFVDKIRTEQIEHSASHQSEINNVVLSKAEQDIRSAQGKFGDIIRESFLALTDEEKENGTTVEQKNTRYEKWFRPMVDEIMAEIGNGNKEVMTIVQNFDLDHESHVQGNKWYSADEAYYRDVQYKLLPEMYEKVQDRIKAEYEEKKIPYVVMYSSESPKFPSENKVYTVTEFNEILMQADSEFHNRKKYAEQKYGSADNYWDLERDDKLPEEDKGIQFGYDKTNFKFFNIPNPRNPEDTFSYEPSRYDIGDGNGSIFDYVRATCSHDEFIEALNALETQLYFPNLDNNHKQIIDNFVSEEKKVLSEKVQEAMKELDEAQSEYKELHKKWLIEASEADRVDNKLKAAVDNIHQVYEDSVNNIYDNVFENIPPTDRSLSLETSTTLRYMSNEAKKLCIESLYQPSRDAQKAMNAEDYKTYNSVDWAKLRRIWEQFPANVNMSNWTNTLLEDKIKDLGIELESHVEKTPAQTVTEEERESNINAAKAVQIENARKQYEAEQGSNYDSNLSTTDIARNLRNYIKQNHPGYKFSVTSQYFSGGSSISVKLKETPVEITNFELMKAYVEQNGDSNNNRIWDSDTRKYTYYSELSEDKKKEFIEQQVRNAHWKNISEYSDDRSLAWMNEDVRKVYQDVIQHLESYNYDHSDSQSDYFSVNFYSHYGITEEAIENSHKHNVQKVRVNNESVSVPDESVEINTDVNQRLDAIINSFKESDLVLNVRKIDDKINVSIHEPESGNMIFTLIQTGNPVVPVLSNDLSMNEYEELKQLATEYFEIITENQTAPEYLENQFAKDIETKTPVQLEIISKASGILNDFDLNYDLLYQNDGENRIQDIEQNIALKFDEAMRANGEFASIVRDLASIREDAFTSDRECAALFISLENAGYLNKITETKDVVIEDVYKLINENNDKKLTQEDLDICKKVVPKQQLAFTLELTKGEEGEFFTNKLKQIADTYRKINTNKELINEDGTHTVGFRYFLGDTEIFLSEIDSDGIGFGYNILNGDLQMSEWGSTSLEEILSIPYMEMDYHVPDNATIEQMLYQEHPEYFSEYAPEDEVKQERNADSYTNEILDKFRAAGIEVITDKGEFERILKEEQKLQKMILENASNENIQYQQQKLNGLIHNLSEDKIKTNTIAEDFAALDKSLRFNANFEIQSEKLGEEVSIFPGSTGKHGLGIRHIIEERTKKDNLNQDEITALSALILETVRTGDITRNSDSQAEFTKNGIVAIVRKDFYGSEKNWVLTGFGYNEQSDREKYREATEAIQTVIAQYSQSPDYSYFRNQVGAVIASLDITISHNLEKSNTEKLIKNSTTYGFAHNGKIYLNPDLMNSNVAVHEYTHLWDAYTQKTNPELWNKGLEIFKDTKYWNEVISDPNYQDIKDDENLVLSEIHARIQGDIAEQVLNRIAELDGKEAKLEAIDWDQEVMKYISSSLDLPVELKNSEELKNFLAMPLKDLVEEKNILINPGKELSKIIHPEINYFVASNIEFEEALFSGLSLEEALAKYEELMSEDHSGYIPCIGIDTKDGSMYDSGPEGHGQVIYAGKNIEDVLKDIKYFKKMPEYVDAMKKLTEALMANGYTVENGNEFLESHKDIIEVNGIKYNSYYNSLKTREICHNIAGDDLDKRNEAVKTMADWFINQNVIGPDDILIPAPQHTGNAEYTKEIAELVSKATGAEIADILKCEPHEPLYEQKQAATPDLDPKLYVDGNIPEGKRLVLIDNVISTGVTFNEANRLIPGITPMVYAITDNANLRYQYEQYYAGTLKRQNYTIYQLKQDPDLHDISFASSKELKSMGKEIDFNNYEMVYSGHIDITHSMRNVNVTSEKIFEQLNNNRPDDYKTHSLSTSDIIVLEKEDGSKQAMFVDDIGFVHNTPELLQFVERMNERIGPDSSVSWNELEKFFDGHIKSQLASFETTKQEVIEERYDNEIQEKDETVGRMLMDNLDWHYFSDDGIDEENELSGKILEEKWSMIEDLEVRIVEGKVKTFEEAQIIINDQLLHSDLYHQVSVSKQKEEIQDIKIVDEKNDAVRYDDKVKELEEQGFSLKEYGLVEYNNFNGPQYSVFSNGQKEITLRYRMEKVDGEQDTWKAGVIYETSEIDIEPVKPLQVYTFSPFGYEGTVVQVETDLRPGIPAFDIVGLADSAVKETRERIQAAFRNSGLEFPAERVLQSLSPADLRKDAPMDLSMALGILGQTNKYPVTEPVLALGELELSGGIRPVRGAVAAVNSAKAAGITNIVCDPTTAELLKNVDGIKILAAENLKEVSEKLMHPNVFQKTEPVIEKTETVQFNDEWMEDYKEALENLPVDGHFETIRAIEIAVAGKHNIIATGAPGCGKTLLTQTLMPALTPKLTEEEAKQITRINSIAGLDSPKRDNLIPPFRMPHQTATIEGICGGGPNCRPGEISLAHQGTLFMDETAEFRSSIIQMLRVPLESRSITLSRAGRSTTYPADFQLAMAMNPCPCGCYGSHDKLCLDSARSIEQYWKKISDPLLDRVEIKTFVQKDEKDTRKISIEEMKAQIATAFEIQRKRGVYNSHMTPEDIQKYCKLDNESQTYLDKEEDKLTPREKSNLLKLSLTIANMAGREEIHINDIKEARELSAPVFEKPRQFVYDPEEQKKATVPQLDDVSITPEQIKEAENERKRITEPVLNGERTEMYTSFKDFEDKGVFEINGTHLNVSKNGGLTPTGWKQLQAAMEIYRSKKFETFRYIIINEKTGEIADQLAITSHMPNFCNVSKPNEETLKQVISRLEELGDDYKLAVCHNHPSGNTTESSFDRELTDSLDRSLRRNDGMNKFLGHIILDHDTFNLAVPSQNNPGKCHWKKMEPQIVNEVDRFTADPKPEWAGEYVGGTSALKAVAVKINDTENWNDDFIPVVFTNADRSITGVQYYSKNFFENESSQIRNEFQFAAMEAGAIGAFPVITDALWNKLGKESNDFEAVMKAHVLNDAFTDVAFNSTTMTEKYDIEAGRNYYSFYKDQSDRKIDVVSTWTPSVNPRLFPPELEQKNEQEVER